MWYVLLHKILDTIHNMYKANNYGPFSVIIPFCLIFFSGGDDAENTLSAQSVDDINLHQVHFYKDVQRILMLI